MQEGRKIIDVYHQVLKLFPDDINNNIRGPIKSLKVDLSYFFESSIQNNPDELMDGFTYTILINTAYAYANEVDTKLIKQIYSVLNGV